ncbi:dihydrodipicolinate synthase family protein [Vagococcus sp.]|uniref:dihydrodipicolinate synthase family protein n=1 Tax=Vagococcus sp. TaxID=1933889 RepID=UPI003F9B25FE
MIKGIAPILAATFDETGAVDYASFKALLTYYSSLEVETLCLFGIATEFYKFSGDEREKVVDLFLTKQLNKKGEKIKKVVSVTDHSAEVAVKRAQELEEKGADWLMIFPPYFLGPSETAIVSHIGKIADAVELPIIIQYAPSQTGVKMSPEPLAGLTKKYPNIKIIKVETQPPGKYLTALLQIDSTISGLVGYAGTQMPDFIHRGGAGVQPGCSFPEIYLKLWSFLEENNPVAFNKLFQRLLPYTAYWMQHVELIISVEKEILYRRGIIQSAYCRTPAYQLDKVEQEMISEFLLEFKDELGR